MERTAINCGEVTTAGKKSVAEDLSHVQCLVDRLPDKLTPEQRNTAEEFIRSHANIFSRSEFDIGRTDILKHRIDTLSLIHI